MMKDSISFQLIDVREEDEHFEFNIGGELMPLSELISFKHLISTDKPVIFYCRKGIRSQFAIQKLERFFPHNIFYNLSGGTDAWQTEL